MLKFRYIWILFLSVLAGRLLIFFLKELPYFTSLGLPVLGWASLDAVKPSSVKGAIIFLLGGDAQDSLDWLSCMAALELHVAPVMSTYPVMVFYEPQLSPNIISLKTATAQSSFEVRFVEVNLSPPPHIPSDAPCPYSRRTRWGYCNMIQFFMFGLFSVPEVLNLDYYWRLDTDSEILGPLREDLFSLMARGGYTYAYQQERLDYLFVTEGLWHSALGFLYASNLTPAWSHLTSILPSFEQANTSMVPMYYNNFEILHVPGYLALPRLREWLAWVDASCGIYLHRWGDAPLRWLTVHFFVDPLRVLQVTGDLLKYKHGLGLGIEFNFSNSV